MEQPMHLPRMTTRTEGPVGWMVFDSPARRNAVSLDMWAAIPAIIARFEADPAIRVIALTGAGAGATDGRGAFVSGADISQFAEQRSDLEQTAAYDRISGEAAAAIKAARKPTIAVIRGWCIGGGFGIAATCDLRWATDSSRFGVPAGRLGLGYAHPGVKTLMDVVGPAYTKEIFFTAKHFTAAEAEQMGFLNRVRPAAEFDAWVAAELALIAANAPLTLAALKITVAELCRGPDGDLDKADRETTACFASADYREGRTAFMEKRPPAFQGR